MYDPSATYRTAAVTSSGPAGQVVLLYQGAIRFGLQHQAFLAQGRREDAHRASLRCQEIVGALRATLDLSAGPVAHQLDSLYAFVLERLVTGNVRRDPQLTEEALYVLRGLLDAWQAIASTPRPAATSVHAAATAATAAPASRPMGSAA